MCKFKCKDEERAKTFFWQPYAHRIAGSLAQESHILSHLYSYNATQDTHSIQKMKLYENKTTTCFHTS